MVETNLPIIFLRNVVVLPYSELRVEFTIDIDKKVLGISEMNHDNHILLVNLTDPLEIKPNITDLPKIGILGKIKSKIELPNGVVRVIILAIDRVEVLSYLENENGYNEAFVIPTKDYDYNEIEATALKRILLGDLNNYIEVSPYVSNNVIGRISGVNSISKLSDIIVYELPFSYDEKLKYIGMVNPMFRIRIIIEDLNKELETVKLENEIEQTLKNKLDSEQKEFVLREKIKVIKDELGDYDIKESDVEEFKKKIDKGNYPSKIKKRLESEIKRYELIPSTSPEVSIVRNYIDWLMELPFNNFTTDNNSLSDIEKILNESHYGLDKIKRRIIEYIAVKNRTNNVNSPIICLVGPPGTGKTSLAKSIAKALNKKFVKISVGGVNDEAEIVGHRRTYIGANPGKIISGMKRAGSMNPLFLIDEIDKITKDYKGDPASALLDILDKEQNSMFVDNYIEEEFDLSNVMFVLTANGISTIPEALRDRLEIIQLSSYTIYEKIEISKSHLINRVLDEHNLTSKNVIFTDSAITNIIKFYTKEAGIRELTRKYEEICRKIVVDYKDNEKYIIDRDNLISYLGHEKYHYLYNKVSEKCGVVNALAFTTYGGEILKVTVTSFKGKGSITLTGSLGDVMKESFYIALNYIKNNYLEFGLDDEVFSNKDFHIHFEEGAVPKDGPSAGVTIVTALLSYLMNIKIDNKISMTGEMTLRGKILPIGGLKEKLIAASTNDIKKIFIPRDNENDLYEIEDYIKNGLKIVLVDDYMEIYKGIFKKSRKISEQEEILV